MKKKEDKHTRYFVDLDLDTQTILHWDYDQKEKLAVRPKNPYHHRLFISKGQYNKLEQRNRELKRPAAKKPHLAPWPRTRWKFS